MPSGHQQGNQSLPWFPASPHDPCMAIGTTYVNPEVLDGTDFNHGLGLNDPSIVVWDLSIQAFFYILFPKGRKVDYPGISTFSPLGIEDRHFRR